jgi:hypothetical protein
VTLSLSTLSFLQVLRTAIRNDKTLAQIDCLQALAWQRLTGAMTGLLRCFSVRVFDYHQDEGSIVLRCAPEGRQQRSSPAPAGAPVYSETTYYSLSVTIRTQRTRRRIPDPYLS